MKPVLVALLDRIEKGDTPTVAWVPDEWDCDGAHRLVTELINRYVKTYHGSTTRIISEVDRSTLG